MVMMPARLGEAAHPRSRGEHMITKEMAEDLSGSSPLARGTCRLRCSRPSPSRLIPARAGNMNGMVSKLILPSAHPRSRGEHPHASTPSSDESGSSPLARGTSLSGAWRLGGWRLIPARAGNISSNLETLKRAVELGSSPLARGTSTPHLYGIAGKRLIPARAGNIHGNRR